METTSKTFSLPVYRVALVREWSATIVGDNRVRTPRDIYDIAKKFTEDRDREIFGVLFLDTKNVVRGAEIVSVGDLSSAIVHPREVFKGAILANAASVIAFHNHPSGDPAPSAEDIATTKRLADAGKILGIDLLDHVVCGESSFVSLAERGLVTPHWL